MLKRIKQFFYNFTHIPKIIEDEQEPIPVAYLSGKCVKCGKLVHHPYTHECINGKMEKMEKGKFIGRKNEKSI